MRQKIKKMVMAALLSVAVLGMSFSAISASAATGSVDECKHPYKRLTISVFKRYTNANQYSHQAEYENTYQCEVCDVLLPTITERTSEPHKQVPGTVYCVCGYQLY